MRNVNTPLMSAARWVSSTWLNSSCEDGGVKVKLGDCAPEVESVLSVDVALMRSMILAPILEPAIENLGRHNR